LSKVGEIVADEWVKTPKIRQEIKLDTFVIMPNHFHAIVWLLCRGDRPVAPTKKSNRPVGPQSQSIGAIMAGFKSAVTKRINEYQNTPGRPFWQRNYYEHVIRDEDDYHRIIEYISTNPQRWLEDSLHPSKVSAITKSKRNTSS